MLCPNARYVVCIAYDQTPTTTTSSSTDIINVPGVPVRTESEWDFYTSLLVPVRIAIQEASDDDDDGGGGGGHQQIRLISYQRKSPALLYELQHQIAAKRGGLGGRWERILITSINGVDIFDNQKQADGSGVSSAEDYLCAMTEASLVRYVVLGDDIPRPQLKEGEKNVVMDYEEYKRLHWVNPESNRGISLLGGR